MQTQAIKFLADIVHQTSGGKIKDPETGVDGEQFLNEQACLDGFAQPDLVGNHHAPQVIMIQNVTNQTDLMGESDDFAGIEAALGVFTNQIMGEQPSQT